MMTGVPVARPLLLAAVLCGAPRPAAAQRWRPARMQPPTQQPLTVAPHKHGDPSKAPTTAVPTRAPAVTINWIDLTPDRNYNHQSGAPVQPLAKSLSDCPESRGAAAVVIVGYTNIVTSFDACKDSCGQNTGCVIAHYLDTPHGPHSARECWGFGGIVDDRSPTGGTPIEYPLTSPLNADFEVLEKVPCRDQLSHVDQRGDKCTVHHLLGSDLGPKILLHASAYQRPNVNCFL
eukprot:gene57418-biopygen85062